MGTSYRSNQPYRSLRTYRGQGGTRNTVDLSTKASILARVKSDCLKTYDEFGYTYDEPGYSYDPVCMGLFTEFVSFRANIGKITLSSVSLQARLSRSRTFTLTAQGRIAHLRSTEITAGGRIHQARTVGLDFRALIRPTGLFKAQARVSQLHTFGLAGQGRIAHQRLTTIGAKAALIRMSFLDMSGRIQNVYSAKLQASGRISRKEQKLVRIRGRIRPYSHLKTRARIKDVSWKRRYVNSLTRTLAQGTVPGKGAVLVHTNGNIYCVYADGYFNGVAERRLWVTISADGGLTWEARIQLSSGNWDNAPSLLQLDESDTASDIGVAFLRGYPRNIYRLTFTAEGVLNYGPQPIMYSTYNTNGASSPSLVKLNNGKFRIYFISPALAPFVSYCDSPSTVYTGTTQWSTQASKVPGGLGTGPRMTALSVRRHRGSGHLIGVINYEAQVNGGASPIYWLDANLTYNLGMIASSDDGANWSAIQPLVVPQDSAGLTLKPKLCPLASDFTELSDGSVGVLYQEGDVHQIINSDTTPQQVLNTIRSTGVVYDENRDTLIFAEKYYSTSEDLTTRGGIVFCQRNALGDFVISFRLEARSTPPLWSNTANGLSLSPDSRYLLIPTEDGLSLLDMQDADHTQWAFQEFRASSLPSIRHNNIQWATWLSNTQVALGYGSSVGSSIWGGMFDISDPVGTFVTLKSPAALTSPTVASAGRVVVLNNVAFFIHNNYLIATDLSTGSSLGSFYKNGLGTRALTYDKGNDEFLCVAGTDTVICVKFNWGTYVFTQVRSFTATSGNPRLYKRGDSFFNCGDNILMPSEDSDDPTTSFYNTVQQTMIGAIHAGDVTPGFGNYPADGRYFASELMTVQGKDWLVRASGDSGIWFMPVDKLGKLRYGVFVYDQTTQKLHEGDAAFYDIESPRTISPSDYSQVEFPRLASRADGTLVIYSRFSAPTRGVQPFAPIITLGWTDGMTVSARARLIPATSLFMRGRISFGRSTNLTMKTRLIVGGNLKTAARIQQTHTGTVSGQARLLQAWAPSLAVGAILRGNNPLLARAMVSRRRIYGLSAQSRVLKRSTDTLAVRGRLVRLKGLAAQARLIPLRAVSLRGKISYSYTKPLTAKAHIHILGRPTLAARAAVRKGLLQTLSGQAFLMHGSAPEMRGRVAQRQGWPVPAGYDPQWLVFNETALRARGRIGDVIKYTAEIGMRTRIHPVKFARLTSQARLVTGHSLQMGAKISPWRSYVYFPCSYSVQKVEKRHVRMVFYSQGLYGVGQLTMRSRIQQKSTKRFTGHFIVPLPRMDGNVIAFNTSNHMHYGQRFTARAFIVRG